jgi:hypothetical protein
MSKKVPAPETGTGHPSRKSPEMVGENEQQASVFAGNGGYYWIRQ